MSIGTGQPSLTRQLPLESYRRAAARAAAGMTEKQARALLEEERADSARVRELFLFDGAGGLIEDEVVRLGRDGDPSTAVMLILVSRIWADRRLATLYETQLTTPAGKLRPERINKSSVLSLLGELQDNVGPKEASNVLGYMAQAHLIDPEKVGPEIVGIKAQLPTSAVVPSVVRFVQERLANSSLVVRPPASADPVDLALGLGVNHWINLTPEEFRRAAHPEPIASAPGRRTAVPAELVILDAELRRRRQVVLQGAPGVGKTHVAMEYVAWASGESGQQASHLICTWVLSSRHAKTASALGVRGPSSCFLGGLLILGGRVFDARSD